MVILNLDLLVYLYKNKNIWIFLVEFKNKNKFVEFFPNLFDFLKHRLNRSTQTLFF